MPTFRAADGTPIHYDERGSGRPLVVLPGGATRHPSYLSDLADLDGRLLIPHPRGVGGTPAPADPRTGSWWRQAQDVEELRKHLSHDKLTLIGHSAGTRLAIAYAVHYPNRVDRVVLITPPAGYLVDVESDAEEITAHRAGDPVFDQAVAAYARTPTTGQDEFDAWRVASAPAGYARWTETEQAHATVGDQRFATVQAYFSVPPPADLAERLTTVAAPVRVIAGAEDYLTGLAPVLALARLFPDGQALVLDDCGHYPFVEQPEAFKRAIAAALTS